MSDESNHYDWLTKDDNIPDDVDIDRKGVATRSSTNLELLQATISDHIFNRMPIRLLQFASDSELELIDRIQVRERISDKMQHITEEHVLALIVQHQKVDLTEQMTDFQSKLNSFGTFSSEGSDLMRKIEEVQRDLHCLERQSQLALGWYGAQALISGRKRAFAELSERYVGYAILSHTWLLPEKKEIEVIYDDRLDAEKWKQIQEANGKGYQKLVNFCKTAAEKHDFSFFWMDTVCIDKKNTSELSESIRSMYRWYSESSLCIAYLENTTSLQDLPSDSWFERGWTLQELLAPKRIKFYSKDWNPLTTIANDKSVEAEQACGLLTKISGPTGISPRALLSFQPGTKDGIASKMVWAATRKTTRGEDRAYSLMGVFAVSISIAYGEGAERAFFRLVEALLSCFSNTLDVLNCAGKPIAHTIHSSRVLPSGPECYLSHDPQLELYRIVPKKPLILTHIGLKVRLLCVEAEIEPPRWGGTEWGTFDGGVRFRCRVPQGSPLWYAEHYTLRLRGKHPVLPDQLISNKFVLGVWSFAEFDDQLSIPAGKCAALLLQVNHSRRQASSAFNMSALSSSQFGSQSKVNTRMPITFSIGHGGDFSCKPGDLERHGTKLLSVYL